MAIVSDGQIFLQEFQKVRSILGPKPPLFVIYANKSDHLSSNLMLFADET